MTPLDEQARAIVKQFSDERFTSGEEFKGILNTSRLERLIVTALRAQWEDVAQQLETEAAAILNEWEHDPLVPHTIHEPVECNGRCDGYCIVQNTFGLLADKLRQRAQGGGDDK